MSKQSSLMTRERRRQLPAQHKPHWQELERGVALGYHKGSKSARWRKRQFVDGRYKETTLGKADDVLEADGVRVLTYAQARDKAVGTAAPELVRGNCSVREAAEDYFAWRKSHSRSAISVRIDALKLGFIDGDRANPNPEAPVRVFGDRQVERLTTTQLQRWLDKRVADAVAETAKAELDEVERRERMRKAQNSANRVWVIFRAMLNHAKSQGRVRSDEAWRAVKLFRNVDRPRKRFLTAAECRRLLAVCEPDFATLARGALETGMRYGELTNLRVKDVVDGAVLIHDSKNGDARRVLLTKDGARYFKSLTAGRNGNELLFVQSDGASWQSKKADRPSTLACSRMRDACAAAEIDPPATFHDLRRTYGSLQYDSGQSLETLAKQWGHRDTRMAQRVYAHRTESTVRASIEKHLPRFALRGKSQRRA